MNYGSPIYPPANISLAAAGLQAAINPLSSLNRANQVEGQLLTDNVINQPIFSVRKVTTNVSIWDGQTVALGGLIREDVQKVNDKVPVLGDIPFAGALFRSEVDQKIKQNLIVFVTARLMDAAGQPLRPEDDVDQEEIVEPLGCRRIFVSQALRPKVSGRNRQFSLCLWWTARRRRNVRPCNPNLPIMLLGLTGGVLPANPPSEGS